MRRSLLEKHIVHEAAKRYARAQCVGYLKKWLHLAMLENPSLATWSSERKGVADLKAPQFRVRKEQGCAHGEVGRGDVRGGLTRGHSVDGVVERAKTPRNICCHLAVRCAETAAGLAALCVVGVGVWRYPVPGGLGGVPGGPGAL